MIASSSSSTSDSDSDSSTAVSSSTSSSSASSSSSAPKLAEQQHSIESDSNSFGEFHTSSSGNSHPPFDIFLPYRLDYLAEMKLTTIFPRKFLYTLRDYEKSKNSGIPVLSLPNCPSGAMRLGAVQLPSRQNMNSFLLMMEELSRRIYRTGMNKTTAGGDFRLPVKGLFIDPVSQLVYTNIDTDFPTDSHGRYIKFMKSLYYRLAISNLTYEIDENIQLDQIVLGMVNDLDEIDLKAFEKTFKNFQVGFLTIGKIIVRPPGRGGDQYKSVFYFDHVSYEPIIGIENTYEDEENLNPNGVAPKYNSKKSKKSKEKTKQKAKKATEKVAVTEKLRYPSKK